MARFYDHPETGEMRFAAPAGGTGGGGTSTFDSPATKELMAQYPREHGAYMKAKRAAAAEAASEADVVKDVEKAEAEVSEVLAHQNVPHGGE